MTKEQLQAIISEEGRMAIGMPATVRWTNSNRKWQGRGSITKINTKSVIVELIEPCGDYPAGQSIKVPRISDFRGWSPNNCLILEDHDIANNNA